MTKRKRLNPPKKKESSKKRVLKKRVQKNKGFKRKKIFHQTPPLKQREFKQRFQNKGFKKENLKPPKKRVQKGSSTKGF
ncbi:hypothetical protein BB388_08105 [Helicobacter pylori]|nr:hypothetical protein BB388_08105 [Helicobacter pylori]